MLIPKKQGSDRPGETVIRLAELGVSLHYVIYARGRHKDRTSWRCDLEDEVKEDGRKRNWQRETAEWVLGDGRCVLAFGTGGMLCHVKPGAMDPCEMKDDDLGNHLARTRHSRGGNWNHDCYRPARHMQAVIAPSVVIAVGPGYRTGPRKNLRSKELGQSKHRATQDDLQSKTPPPRVTRCSRHQVSQR